MANRRKRHRRPSAVPAWLAWKRRLADESGWNRHLRRKQKYGIRHSLPSGTQLMAIESDKMQISELKGLWNENS
jgi:hypothetical protein